MVTKVDFATLESGQVVSLIVGEDDQSVVLSAWVVWASHDVIQLQVVGEPVGPDLMSCGTPVFVVRSDGLLDRARVSRCDARPTPAITLEVLPFELTPQDQRRFSRVPTLVMEDHASFVTIDQAIRFRVQVIDISGGGACLLSPNPLVAGDELDLHLPEVDGCAAVDIPARVVWVRALYRSWMVGLRYADLSQDDIDLIERTVFLMNWQGAA